MPCTVLALAVGGVVTKFFFALPSLVFNFSEFYSNYVIRIFAGVVAGGWAIKAAYVVAPYGKKLTAFILFIILTVLTVGIIFLNYRQSRWDYITEELMIIVGAFFGLKHVEKPL